MAEELETGKVVYYEGRWVKVEEAKGDTMKAGESAAKAAEKMKEQQEATRMFMDMMSKK
jgi:hypothetical protein